MRRTAWAPALLAATILLGTDLGAQSTNNPAPAAPSPTLRADLASAPAGARVAALVIEVQTGRVIFEHNADAALNPASNTKLITAAVALSVLGPSHTFVTALQGRVSAGAIQGPLVLRGGGDPSLETADLFALAREVATLGVHRVEGDLLVDDTALGTEHMPPAFEQRPAETAAFRAAVSAASVDANAMAVRVRPGPAVGGPALVFAEPDGYLVVENHVTTTANGTPEIQLQYSVLPDGREQVIARGTIPAATLGRSWHRRIENPSLATGHALRAALAAFGVTVAGTVRVGAAPAGLPELAHHESAPLSALLYEVGKESNNYYAETLLLDVGAIDPAVPPTFAAAVARERDWLQGHNVPLDGLELRNGSGLYDANRVSARQLAAVLRAAWLDPAIRDEYIAQLSVAGDDGTLHDRLHLPDARRRVRAKTGTLNDVVALSGYVLSAGDPDATWAFALITNNVSGEVDRARAFCDRLVTDLVALQPH